MKRLSYLIHRHVPVYLLLLVRVLVTVVHRLFTSPRNRHAGLAMTASWHELRCAGAHGLYPDPQCTYMHPGCTQILSSVTCHLSRLNTIACSGRAGSVFPASKCRRSQHKRVPVCTVSSLCRYRWGSAPAHQPSHGITEGAQRCARCPHASLQKACTGTREEAVKECHTGHTSYQICLVSAH